MGQSDYCLKRYLCDETRFADLINGTIGEGEQLVSPSDLTDMDSQVGYRRPDHQASTPAPEGRTRSGIRHRDLLKKAAFGVNFLVIGLEHQERPHYLMPLRCMGYDVREYERQATMERARLQRWKKMRRRGEVDQAVPIGGEAGTGEAVSTGSETAGESAPTPAEFLSGFRKSSRLSPCITIVLHFGEEWDAATHLRELLDFSHIPPQFRRLINDYSIYLVDVRKLQDEDTQKFQTDLRLVFDCIRFAEDKDKLRDRVLNNPEFNQLSEDSYDLISCYTKVLGDSEIAAKYKQGGRMIMCKGMKDLLADERAEGKAEGMASLIVSILNGISQISDELRNRIMSQQDQAILERWGCLAASVESVSEFEMKM